MLWESGGELLVFSGAQPDYPNDAWTRHKNKGTPSLKTNRKIAPETENSERIVIIPWYSFMLLFT